MNEVTKTCPKCGNVFSGNFCSKCGHAMLSACPHCHTPLKGDDKFCPNCGKSLTKSGLLSGATAKLGKLKSKLTPKTIGIIVLCSVLVLALGLGLGLGIPALRSPFREKKLNALALGMTTDEVKMVLKNLDDVVYPEDDVWEIYGGKANDIMEQMEKNEETAYKDFVKALGKEYELRKQLEEIEYEYLYLKFSDGRLSEILYDSAHKYKSYSSSEEYLFNTANEKSVSGCELSRNEIVVGGILSGAWISCKVKCDDGSFYTAYLNGSVDTTAVGEQKLSYKTAWFETEITLNVVEKLSTECPGHKLDTSCKCSICGIYNHVANAECVCEECGKEVAHTPNSECLCTRCNAISHNYEASGICSQCGDVDLDKIASAINTNGYFRNDDFIYFGTYPQSEVTDISIKTALGGYDSTWTSYGYYINGAVSNYMYYKDKEYADNKYRGVYFTSYRPNYTTNSSLSSNSYQGDNGYYISTVYWFKYEPIKWSILKDNGDGTALILSELLLDSQEYYISSNSRTVDGQTVYANNYEHSTIRAWLNDEFYNTAFNSVQKALIETTEVDNSVASAGYSSNKYACENTNDKIFLPSYVEVTTYEAMDSNSEREKQTTDYAQSQGACTDSGDGYWWLRSPYSSSGFARSVNYDGDGDFELVYNTLSGVSPALVIRLS